MEATILGKEFTIRNKTFRNRIVMAPMGTGMAWASGEVSPQMLAYYQARARGGAGLIIVEFTCVDTPRGRASPHQLGIDRPEYQAGLHQLCSAIKAFGARVFIQLHHAGRQTSLDITRGRQPLAPSAISCRVMKTLPREMDLADIAYIKKQFFWAAASAVRAGFDGIELHAAHGYLLNQFLSPHTNHRNDEYGGSNKNRTALLTEIIKAIREAHPTLIIGVRYNGSDFIPGGIDPEMAQEIAVYLEEAGADILHISSGMYESGKTSVEPPTFGPGWKTYLARGIKEKINIPVISGGMIKTPSQAARVIKRGESDFIFIGRGLLADPDWALKALLSRARDIRPCITCNHCINSLFRNQKISCTVNPLLGLEGADFPRLKSRNIKINIVGGGPGGMQAAHSLFQAGAQVTLFEQKNQLGGTLNLASIPPGKKHIADFTEYMIAKTKKTGVKLLLHREFTMEDIRQNPADAIIIATGARPVLPAWTQAMPSSKLFTPEHILQEKNPPYGENIIIIGGGSSGCELADYLLDFKNSVTLVEKEKSLARDLAGVMRQDLLSRIRSKGVMTKTDSWVVEANGHHIIISRKGTELSPVREALKYDRIITACGYAPDHSLYQQVKAMLPLTFLIGDAREARGIREALLEADTVAKTIIHWFNQC